MIIRNKNISNNSQESSSTIKNPGKKNILKKDDLIKGAQKNEVPTPEAEPIKEEKPKPVEMETFEKIDISSIEFKERIERRRGDRRRGYRRIDERSLVSRAQQEAHTIKELAAREGYKNGLAKAEQEIKEIKDNLSEFLDMREEMYNDFYPHIMEIALAATRKIIKKEVEMSNDILKTIIDSVMEEINPDAQKIEIKVNSQDYEFAKLSLPEIIEAHKTSAKITVGQDDMVEKGSCIVIANNGVIDANFKTQLAVLQSTFGIYQGGF